MPGISPEPYSHKANGSRAPQSWDSEHPVADVPEFGVVSYIT